jgi:hypothetical protein
MNSLVDVFLMEEILEQKFFPMQALSFLLTHLLKYGLKEGY